MAEDYKVHIATTADSTGAQEIEASLDRVGGKAVAIDERQASLAQQKESIAVQQLKALQAEALGQAEVAAELQREVNLRALALRLQQQSNISEAEALAIAKARSVEGDKIYGKAGKFKLFQNLGLDSDTAKTLGIATLAGFQLSSYIEEAAKYYDDLRITGEKESIELQKQVESWRSMAASARDLNDVSKLQESITKSVTDQLQKARELPSEGTKGFFQNTYDALVIYDTALRQLIGDNTRYTTSTDDAIAVAQKLAEVQQAAGDVYVRAAQKNAEAIRALLALPYAEAVSKAREEIAQLNDEQERLNRSDVKQEQAWQRKQTQIGQLASAIDRLAAEHALLARKEELETQVALATDPQKRASARKELEELQLNVLIRQKIKEATDLAAAAGKGWTDAESKAIENEIRGPLEAKLKILRELAQINPAGGYQQQIDKLLHVKPVNATDSAKLFYEKIVQDAKATAGEIQNAKANLELILQQELRDNAKTTTPPTAEPPGKAKLPSGLKPYGDAESATQSAEEIGKAIADSASKMKAAVEASVAQIAPTFDPVSKSIAEIPRAVTEGVASITATVGSLSAAMKSELNRRTQELQQQIDALWRSI
jgi:hypothetical protein